jgi:hypothetical protein
MFFNLNFKLNSVNATCKISVVAATASDPVDSSVGIFNWNYTTVGGKKLFST